MAIELLVSNLSGDIRYEQLRGRKHVVVPLTMVREGVLNGSKGPLFYPADELGKSAASWNRIPIVVYHPSEDGRPTSAKQPQVVNRSEIGEVYNAVLQDGSLVAEGWFDIERARQVAPLVLANVESGQPQELSTGLITDNEKSPGEYQGTRYDAIARNYRPDHLAILPDQVGACSLADGCGVGVLNSAMVDSIENAKSFSDIRMALQDLIDGGIFGAQNEDRYIKEVYADGTFVLEKKGKLWKMRYSVEDDVVTVLDNTPEEVQLVTSYVPVPITNTEDELMAALTKKRRKEIIDNLVANCSCWDADDTEVLNAFTDAKLNQLDGGFAEVQRQEVIANAAIAGSKAGNFNFNYDVEKGEFVANEETVETPAGEEVVNESKPKTMAEWMADAPAEVQSVVANAQAREAKERTDWIETVIANESNTFTKEELGDMTSTQLEKMSVMFAKPAEEGQARPNYSGAATHNAGGTGEGAEAEVPLAMPTLNCENDKLTKALS